MGVHTFALIGPSDPWCLFPSMSAYSSGRTYQSLEKPTKPGCPANICSQQRRSATESEISMNFESRNPLAGELLAVYLEHDTAGINTRLQRAWDGRRRWSRAA
jgi:hypothetical protein